MKLKNKLFYLGMIALATLSLSACSNKNSDQAKKDFISATVEMSDPAYNNREMTFKVDHFKSTSATTKSSDQAQLNNVMSGLNVTTKSKVDTENKRVSMDFSTEVLTKKVAFNILVDKSGIYMPSKNIKDTYEQLKQYIPSDAQTKQTADIFMKNLTKTYIFAGADILDSGLQSSGTTETWAKTFEQSFGNSKAVSSEDLTTAFKDVANTAFTKDGDKITYQTSEKDIKLSDLIKKTAVLTQQLSKEQLDTLIKQTQDVKIDSINLKQTVDSKTHTMTLIMDGKISDAKNSKNTVEFKFNASSSASKSKDSIQMPAESDRMSVMDLFQLAMLNAMAEQSSAT